MYPQTSFGNSTRCGGVLLVMLRMVEYFTNLRNLWVLMSADVWIIYYAQASGFNVLVHQFGYTPKINTDEEHNGIIFSSIARGRAPEHIAPQEFRL